MDKAETDKSLTTKTILMLIVVIVVPVLVGVYYGNSKCMNVKDGVYYNFIDEDTILAFSAGKEAFVTLNCEYVDKDGKQAIWRVTEKSQIRISGKSGTLCTDDDVIVDDVVCLAQVGNVRDELRVK